MGRKYIFLHTKIITLYEALASGCFLNELGSGLMRDQGLSGKGIF